MNDLRYRWILYTIVIVILSTIGIQVYWNYKNYLNSKQQLINEVQISLDKAVDDYYAHLAEQSTIGFAFKSLDSGKIINNPDELGRFIHNINRTGHKTDSLHIKLKDSITVLIEPEVDSILEAQRKGMTPKIDMKMFDIITQIKPDSTHIAKFRSLTSKVVISLTRDTLYLKEIDSLLKLDLMRKHINIEYGLNYEDHNGNIRTYSNFNLVNELSKKQVLSTKSESTFLPKGSALTIKFTNETQIILKRIFGGIVISILLVLAIISSLFYLLHIIKHQKQLAEVKNDLISNITHEFKTPIATIGVALESIKDFKIIEDKEKTKKYLELSSGQLIKLNTMVEKLLETATLDSDSLNLVKESVNIVDLLKAIVEKHQMQTEGKSMSIQFDSDSILASVDEFHFENAINNVLDNALKYGGDEINVSIAQNPIAFTVSISDNGHSITKAHKEKIFEKFYRIPKGNTHDVKGFGIGLYYTKKIVEKHGGSIHLELEKNHTTFKLSFPNA